MEVLASVLLFSSVLLLALEILLVSEALLEALLALWSTAVGACVFAFAELGSGVTGNCGTGGGTLTTGGTITRPSRISNSH